MTTRVLFVDDEPRILDGIRRMLRNDYDLEVAVGGNAGLDALDREEFAVIVSDMRMPELSGSEFLAIAADRQPDAVQMILSGQADLSSTVDAVNRGHLFRFLLKPIDRDALRTSLTAAMEQFRLRRVEKELLQQTLAGAVDALGEILALASPQATHRATLVRSYVARIAEPTDLRDDWQLNVAAALANIGSLAVPDDVIERSAKAEVLTHAEQQMLARHPHVASDVIARIPRMDGVAEIVRAQNATNVETVRPELVDHASVLQLASAIADKVLRGVPEDQAILLVEQSGRYPEALLKGLRSVAKGTRLAELPIDALRVGMILRNPLCTPAGLVIANAGTRLTAVLVARIHNFAAGVGVQEPIIVECAVE